MLHVFHVNGGIMHNVSVDLAGQKVKELKTTVYHMTNIPVIDHVILDSDGTLVDDDKLVGIYKAGFNETCPLYLYTKENKVTLEPNFPDVKTFKDEMKAAAELPHEIRTISSRYMLAEEIRQKANDVQDFIKESYNCQLLQRNGWSAIVENHDNAIDKMKKNIRTTKLKCLSVFNEDNFNLVKNVDKKLLALKEIKLPKSLAKFIKKEADIEDLNEEKEDLFSCFFDESWPERLEENRQKCLDFFERYEALDFNEYDRSLAKILNEGCDNSWSSMKIIQGLEERITGLARLLEETKRACDMINDIYSQIAAHHLRTKTSTDDSAYAELCISHTKLLEVMEENYDKIARGIREKVVKARNELRTNINLRLMWVYKAQSSIAELDKKVYIAAYGPTYVETQLKMFSQVFAASDTFFVTIAEIVRRKKFASNFYKINCALKEQFKEIHSEEVSMRQNFLHSHGPNFIIRSFANLLSEFPENYLTAEISLPDYQPQFPDDELKYILEICPDRLKYLFNVDENIGVPGLCVKGLSQIESCDENDVDDDCATEAPSEDFQSALGSPNVSIDRIESEEDFEEIASLMEETIKPYKPIEQIDQEDIGMIFANTEGVEEIDEKLDSADDIVSDTDENIIRSLEREHRLRESIIKDEEINKEHMINDLKKKLEEEKEEEINKIKVEMEKEHELKLKEIQSRIDLQQSKAFSSALKEIYEDKDRIIEDLRIKLRFMTDELDKVKNVAGPWKQPENLITFQNKSFPDPNLFRCFYPDIHLYRINKDDLVVFAWDEERNSYRAVLIEPLGYVFLQSECHQELGIDDKLKYPVKGRIYETQKCRLKKSKNRYNLPAGEIFSRVRACNPNKNPDDCPVKLRKSKKSKN